MKVVVVESPAKAKTINKYLGSDYKVLASYGHIRDLPSKDGSVDPDHGFEMLWEVANDSKKHVKAIADALISDASSVANEYTLLDRPIVFIDVPELFEKYRDSIDLEGWGQSSGPVAKTVEDVHRHLEASFSDPSTYAAQRRRIAEEGFYHPGRATDAAMEAIAALTGSEER